MDSIPLQSEAPAPGLQRAGARLPIGEYTRRLWHRRWFVVAYATATNNAGYERSFLGQAWQLLTPTLRIVVYYVIFGLLLHTNRGVPNFIAFLAVGVFAFSLCQSALVSGSRSITANLGLVRALQFPRAVLPISNTLVSLQQLIYGMIVILPILLISGVMPSLRWLELLPAIALQALFCLGITFAVARIGARIPDATQLLPFVARIWMYTSGVMYSVTHFTAGHPAWITTVLTINPAYVYLSLARAALLGTPATAQTWLYAAGW
ncbi:MAG: ABC transporter permease, partial [Microlunatus sp.]|nr:ABC transporter permease [Microlunatus sp.]